VKFVSVSAVEMHGVQNVRERPDGVSKLPWLSYIVQTASKSKSGTVPLSSSQPADIPIGTNCDVTGLQRVVV